MSNVAAVMLVKDEADVIGHSVGWLLTQVDAIFVYDNGSTDGTREILDRIATDTGRVLVFDDPEPGYFQGKKTSDLAMLARDEDYAWAVPADADEFWRCADPDYRIGDFLGDLQQDYLFAAAELYDHKVTAVDGDDPNPARRMCWRFRHPSKLPKIAIRLDGDPIEIGMGNHEAMISNAQRRRVSSTGSPPRFDGGLVVEHYSWRSADQMVKKIRNGAAAYAATNLPEQYGAHWRSFAPDEPGFESRVRGWFGEWAFASEPEHDPSILYSPFPFP